MDYKKVIQDDLDRGFTKRDLEVLIGLPKNNLSAFMNGKKEFPKKALLRIERWEKSEKPDPLFSESKVAMELAKLKLAGIDFGNSVDVTDVIKNWPNVADLPPKTVNDKPEKEKSENKPENASSEPVKREGESSLDFRVRKAEYFDTLKNK